MACPKVSSDCHAQDETLYIILREQYVLSEAQEGGRLFDLEGGTCTFHEELRTFPQGPYWAEALTASITYSKKKSGKKIRVYEEEKRFMEPKFTIEAEIAGKGTACSELLLIA